MGGPHIDALRISPRFTSNDWYALERHSQDDWAKAADMVKDRLDGRFLHYAGNCLRSPYSGFVVLAIDSLLIETLQQFREGITNGHGKSQPMVTRFLEGQRFQPEFDQEGPECILLGHSVRTPASSRGEKDVADSSRTGSYAAAVAGRPGVRHRRTGLSQGGPWQHE